MAILSLLPSFNAGEISPLLDARVTLEKYGSGCRTLKNFIILPYGGAIRRPGTQYLGAAKNANKRARLIGFNFSATTSFVLEFGEQYIRFWSNGERVELSGSPVEVATPYLEADLRDVQFVQVNDIMYFTHPNYSPRKLTRNSDTDWTFAEIDWTWPAFLDENTEETTITPSATTGTITLTASAAVFTTENIGSFYAIAHRRDTAYVEQVLSSTGTSGGIDVLGDWELTTYGNWDGRLKVQRSYDGTNWETIRTYESASAGERNVSATGKEEKACKLRLDYTADAAGSSNPNARLEAADNRVYGVVKVTAFTSSTVVTATVTKTLSSTAATKVWQEGAFSTRRGFPRTVTLHEQRLIFAATSYKPLTVWGSVTDDFENFRYSTNDDGAFSFSLSANESNPINWMVSQGKLLLGTAGDEWTLGASDDTQSLGPTNVSAKRQSSYGSKYLQARIVNEVVLFCQRQGRKVRELTYSFEKDGWVAPDLTLLANHITEGEIAETAFQQQPDAIFWCVTGEGKLIGMTYERDQQVVGWHRHETQGLFESVATIYGASGADEVWLLVNRTVNGATVRYLERFKPDHRETLENEDKPNWWYLDCAKQSEPGSASVTGLSHLEGLEVGILKDGATHPARTVSGGAITLQSAADKVLVGLPFESELLPMKLNADMQDGTSQGRRARVPRLVIRFYKSLGGKYSTNGTEWNDIFSRSSFDPMDDSPPVFTGDKKVYTGGTYGESGDVYVRQSLPMPMVILALIPKWEVTGD